MERTQNDGVTDTAEARHLQQGWVPADRSTNTKFRPTRLPQPSPLHPTDRTHPALSRLVPWFESACLSRPVAPCFQQVTVLTSARLPSSPERPLPSNYSRSGRAYIQSPNHALTCLLRFNLTCLLNMIHGIPNPAIAILVTVSNLIMEVSINDHKANLAYGSGNKSGVAAGSHRRRRTLRPNPPRRRRRRPRHMSQRRPLPSILRWTTTRASGTVSTPRRVRTPSSPTAPFQRVVCTPRARPTTIPMPVRTVDGSCVSWTGTYRTPNTTVGAPCA